MSAAPTLCLLAHGLKGKVDTERRPQAPEQEPQPQHRSRLSALSSLVVVALLSLVFHASEAIHPVEFGCCLALTVADRFRNRRHFGSAAFGLSPVPYR